MTFVFCNYLGTIKCKMLQKLDACSKLVASLKSANSDFYGLMQLHEANRFDAN